MRSYTYGDPNFKGNGILRCRICGEPYRDHRRIGPCDALGDGNREVTAPRRQSAHSMSDDERAVYEQERTEAKVNRERLYGKGEKR